MPFAKKTLAICAALAVLLMHSATTAGQSAGDALLVHISDPHLFVDNTPDDATKRLRENNIKAFDAMMKWLATLPGDERSTRLLVLTGDVDADPCWLRNPPASGAAKPTADVCISQYDKTIYSEQVDRLAVPLATSPIRDVYVVPGNNDIAYEQAGDAAIKFFDDFMEAVQKQIAAKGGTVRIHNLGRCYAGDDDAQCFADVSGTNYRLVAFPSYSFKNREQDNSYTVNAPIQEKQVKRFSDLIAKVKAAGKRAIVITHVPEIDDPFTMAQDLFKGTYKQPQGPPVPNRSKWSTWAVSQAVLSGWRDALASETVAGVLAGHLHDSHKEIYRQPYAWSPPNEYRNAGKLFLAPPLAIKNQDTSPIQARGFSLVRLLSDHVERQLYWLDPQSATFSPDVPPRSPEAAQTSWSWLKEHLLKCAKLVNPCESLDRLAAFFIALLSAFLTVVQVWQIPPPTNALTEPPPSKDAKSADASANKVATGFEPSPFAGNFGKTVIAGLGGLAADAVLKSLENKPAAADKEFYIVWFVTLFFATLFGLAWIRGIVEAIRSRVVVIYYTPQRPPVALKNPNAEKDSGANLRRLAAGIKYWIYRFTRWIFSWRTQLLTFADTFINLIQGKNQTRTQLFAETIVEQNRNVIRVSDAIRRRLTDVIKSQLAKPDADSAGIRVNISVLSADQSRVFYIAKSPGSADKAFNKRSIAWVSVFTGKIRWYKDKYWTNRDRIVLFDNSDGFIADDEKMIHLGSHYQERSQDYKAFLVIPVPWPQRSFGSRYVKGGIHISFANEADFEKLWSIKDPLPEDDHEGTYPSGEQVLDEWCNDAVLKTALLDSVNVLGELLRGFNENIYLNSGGSDQTVS